jgi:hypothetical protein
MAPLKALALPTVFLSILFPYFPDQSDQIGRFIVVWAIFYLGQEIEAPFHIKIMSSFEKKMFFAIYWVSCFTKSSGHPALHDVPDRTNQRFVH